VLLGQSGEQRQLAVGALLQPEQAGERLADQLGRHPARRGGGGGGQSREAQALVGFPHPVGGGAKEIRLALGLGAAPRHARRPRGPAGNVELDRSGLAGPRPHPQVEILIALGRNRGARDGDSEASREAGERGELRHRQRPLLFAAGGPVQRGEARIGLDQPPFAVDSAANGALGHHADSLARAAR
jgi:hypothetical protein